VLRRLGIITLAALTLLAPLACRRFHRRCDNPRDTVRPDDRDTDPGFIPPRGSTIDPPGVPVRPGTNRNTYSTPRLEMPVEPYRPATTDVGTSPFELPQPIESRSRKLFDPAEPKVKDDALPKATEEPAKPKKLLLIPDKMPDSPEKAKEPAPESKYTPQDGTKAEPDRRVLLDPVAPGGPFDLPRTDPVVVEEREGIKSESKASPKPDTPPTGLSGFQSVTGKANVASGQKPTRDGYEWLAKNGYKTVVFAHAPPADVAPVKAQCEAAGLKFLPIPTGPETIPAAAAAFDAAIAGVKDGPVYVCDDSGLRAATLWYVHFRKVDLTPPDAAKVRANGLGLGDTDTNPEQKKLWDAAESHLGTK
jgi:protein tyrosine phosphatase (PTP) superfamily phosphohydrolase (DUF442 family)